MNQSKFNQLIVMDFPAIKQFVFGTERLVEIRGASALLDHLNRSYIPELMQKYFGSVGWQKVFAGGGAAQFIVKCDDLENTQLQLHKIQGEVFRKTGGTLRVIAGIAKYKEKKYSVALQHAFLNLERIKQQNPFESCSSLHSGFIRECASCSGMVSGITEYAKEKRLLCQACIEKERAGKERGLWEEFSLHLQNQEENCQLKADKILELRPKDFEEIGELCKARSGYTALVYGDGNAMGKIVKQIDSEERFKLFSTSVDEAVRESCYEALYKHCVILKDGRPIDGKIPADILLLGGDDLIVYLTADKALPFAIDASKLFEEKTRQKLCEENKDDFFSKKLDGKGITLSMGIAYAKSHTPISIMVEQAEELLKSAKKKGTSLSSTENYTPACIDFHMSSHFNQMSVSDCRREHLTQRTRSGKIMKFYHGPFTLAEAEKLLGYAVNLKHSGIPASRLHRLGDAPFKGEVNGSIETMTVIGRCKNDSENRVILEALDHFGCISVVPNNLGYRSVVPWKIDNAEISTVLVDLVNIAEFTNNKEDNPDAP